MAYLTNTPKWLRALQPKGLIWEVPKAAQRVFLTFDDGPHPDITPWVLKQLQHYAAKATFFCIGDNVQKYPEVYAQIIKEGHSVGNHTAHHVNGWKAPRPLYLDDVAQAAESIDSSLFRPPYGKITFGQSRVLKRQYKIIMWSVLSGDFDKTIDGHNCVLRVKKYLQPGGIAVFHDSEKAWPRLQVALPEILQYCQKQGWQMPALQLNDII